MARDTIALSVVGGPAHLLGCSDGAIVTLLAALRRRDLIRRTVLIAGVLHPDGWAPGVVDPDDEPPGFLARLYADLSPEKPAVVQLRDRRLPHHRAGGDNGADPPGSLGDVRGFTHAHR